MKTMRKGNDEIYQLAKDLALVKKLENNKRFRPVCLCPPGVMYYNKYKLQTFSSHKMHQCLQLIT